MEWYLLLAVLSAALCLTFCLAQAIRLIRLGKPNDYAKERGNTPAAIWYSYTMAMNPAKKESAFLHLPTYVAGLLFHLGTFASLILFLLTAWGIVLPDLLADLIVGALLVTGLCGMGILLKRLLCENLRALSNPDDYISNLLVTAVQFLTAGLLLNPGIIIPYCLVISLLFLYLPAGKLRHTIYFFAARYHLGFFYGRRGTWPPNQS